MKNKSEKQTQMRRCVNCRESKHKSEMLRIVRTPEGKFCLDFTGKANGRGAYICKNENCAAETKKRRKLDKSFKTALPAEIYDEILEAVAEK